MARTADRIVAGPVEWTQQGARLWVGRRDGASVGTIERGRRFVVIDTEGMPTGSFRTFGEAVGSGATSPRPEGAATTAAASDRLQLVVAAVAALVMTALFVLTATVVL